MVFQTGKLRLRMDVLELRERAAFIRLAASRTSAWHFSQPLGEGTFWGRKPTVQTVG